MPAAKPLDVVELAWGDAMLRAGVGGRLIARTIEEKRQVLRKTGAARRELELSHQHVLDQLKVYRADQVDRQNGAPSKRALPDTVEDARQNDAAELDGRRSEGQATRPEGP